MKCTDLRVANNNNDDDDDMRITALNMVRYTWCFAAVARFPVIPILTYSTIIFYVII